MALANGVKEILDSYQEFGHEWLTSGSPWFTQDSISWLENNIMCSDTVSEVGAGRSTLWWLSRVNMVHSIETSPDWTLQLFLELYQHPHLLKRFKLTYVPADWHPSWKAGRKDYWQKHQTCLTLDDVFRLQIEYLDVIKSLNSTVLCLDGGIRGYTMVLLKQLREIDRFELVIVDNTESRFHSMYFDKEFMSNFKRLDFVRGTLNQFPDNPKKHHVTTIFVRNDRWNTASASKTENKIIWDEEELAEFQDFTPDSDSIEVVRNYEAQLLDELKEMGLL